MKTVNSVFKGKVRWEVLGLLSVLLNGVAYADETPARCDIYIKGSEQPAISFPCTFSQRRGHVTITRSDEVTYSFIPIGDTPGNYEDQKGNAVYRQRGLGVDGVIFKLKNESVYIYWDATSLEQKTNEKKEP
ncbi:hypothetical protein C9J48_05320 [Photobacterium profundum]|uniref:Uncharacterized protein n=1 Tax=Photobacterium profundum 3TCK TaxID=314280 RepID=Q1Z6X6_9GAMM|nr:hypothetical protein [Photobacterium profundum]EAS44327.1 hypothetical protein P3TCK_06327 [Photobacterium profundum 3TCK]PSV62917.1 hypothetical protein C9J48_05320 [Photobacterium profundum]